MQSLLMPTVMDRAENNVNKLAKIKITRVGFVQLLEATLAVAVHQRRNFWTISSIEQLNF